MFVKVEQSVGIWGVGRFWLTFQDTDPCEIDFDELDRDESVAFKTALCFGHLYETDAAGKRMTKKKSTIVEPVKMVADGRKGNPFIDRKMQAILDGNLISIKREISLIKDPNFLLSALKLETTGKARKGVLELIEKQIEKHVPPARDPFDEGYTVVETEQQEIAFPVQHISLSHSETKTVVTPMSIAQDKAIPKVDTGGPKAA